MKKLPTNLGFTLVELMVVISIIAILSVIGREIYSSVLVQSRDTKRVNDLKVIEAALEQYYADQSNFPVSLSSGGSLSAGGKIYLNPIPQDPLYAGVSGSDYAYNPYKSGPTSCDDSTNMCNEFCLSAKMEENVSADLSECGSFASGYNFQVSSLTPNNTLAGNSSVNNPQIPAPTFTPVPPAPTNTPTPEPTAAPTNTPISTPTPTNTPTPTPSVKYVFETTNTYSPLFSGGAAGADSICQSLASASQTSASQPGTTYKAWISDSNSSPSTRFSKPIVPYKLLNNTLIANNWTDLTSGSIRSFINIDQNGNIVSVSGGGTWTNTRAAGTANGSSCSNWTSNSASFIGTIGSNNATNSGWSNTTTANCQASYHLYCFEQ